MDNQFIVWCPTSHRPPKVIHDAYAKASTEAQRLAEENIGAVFHVAQIVGTAVAPRPKAKFTMHVHPSQVDVDMYLAEAKLEAETHDRPEPARLRGWLHRIEEACARKGAAEGLQRIREAAIAALAGKSPPRECGALLCPDEAPELLQVREGGWYRRRDGEIVGPAEDKKGRVRSNPWLVGTHFYTDDGQWVRGCPDPRDLIEEVPAPAAPAATDDGEIPF